MQAQARKMKPITMRTKSLIAEPVRPTRPRRRWPLVFTGLVIVLLALAAARRIHEHESGAEETIADPGVREVSTVRPEAVRTAVVTLPASLQGYQATDLYPRVDGFIKTWKVEIGTRVRAGQLLAEIDTPELDQEVSRAEAQVKQAVADLEQARAELEETKSDVALNEANLVRAKANLRFAVAQVERYRRLSRTQAVSREDLDRIVSDHDARAADTRAAQADLARRKTNLGTRQATILSKEAMLANQEANVRRLRELQGFKRIIAPFDGVIARRSAEVGMLVTAGATPGARPLYRVVQTDVLRVQLPMPQAFAAQVRTGDQASILVPERPGHAFPARVARTTGEIDTATRTVLVELELSNRDGALLPGTYAEVRIEARRAEQAWIVPTPAVLLRSEGAQVAVVRDGTVQMQPVELGRNHGDKVEVLRGLSGSEQIIANPTDDLHNGSKVKERGSTTLARLPL